MVAFIPKTSDDQVERTHLLHWYIVGDSGRVADLDDRNAVKAIVPVGSKRFPLSFNDMSMSMILPRTGVSLVKEKRKDRPVLPPAVLRIMKLWDMSLSFRHGVTAGHIAPRDACDFCQNNAHITSSNNSNDSQGDCKVCPCCLMTGHASCFRAVKHAYDIACAHVASMKSSDGRDTQLKRRRIAWPIPQHLPTAFVWDDLFASSGRPGLSNVGQNFSNYVLACCQHNQRISIHSSGEVSGELQLNCSKLLQLLQCI